MAAFNGGIIVMPDMTIVDERVIPTDVAPAVIDTITALGLYAWIYRGAEWYVKIVGVSDEHEKVARCAAAVRQKFLAQVSAARSQPHYLDVTHPTANKGVVVERLSHYYKIPLEQIASLGDQPNDVLMFQRSGLSIAMGNASVEVKSEVTFVTASNEDEGFAKAIEEFILPLAVAAPVLAPNQVEEEGSDVPGS
jgi:hydroxymethylpyrimidine pyrophosphatase-like HAD family hydrolase